MKSSDYRNYPSCAPSLESLSKDQQLSFGMTVKGQNLFIGGCAGTGKSHLIKAIFYFQVCELKKRVAITSPTMNAAFNLGLPGASTLHGWMSCGLAQGTPEDLFATINKNKFKKINWLTTDVLIIDEASMVTPYMLHKINIISKSVRKNVMPYGGIQVILVGDFMQLGPILEPKDSLPPHLKDKSFIFELPDFTIDIGHIVILDTIFRQKDSAFKELLHRVRTDTLTEEDIHILKSRVNAPLALPPGYKATKVFTHKDQVEETNAKYIQSLSGRSYFFEKKKGSFDVSGQAAEIELTNLEKRLAVEDKLELKVGASVILIVNPNKDMYPGLCNGSMGIVKAFTPIGLPLVEFTLRNEKEEKKEVIIQWFTWTYEVNAHKKAAVDAKSLKRKASALKVNKSPHVWVSQIPLIVAAACTSHRVQGLTLDWMEADLSRAWASGQAYVILSRVRSLENFTLTSFDPACIIVDPKIAEFYKRNSGVTNNLIQALQ
jgi:ATP-dependent DNA helicase PIF1